MRTCFNPHPAFLPGDAVCLLGTSITEHSFNPHPAFLPGDAICWCTLPIDPGEVSIRTRHFCRVMLGVRGSGAGVLMFQSAPGISAG